MQRFFVCTVFCLILPTGLWASSEDSTTAPEFAPAKTAFAYRARHSAAVLPDRAFNALWFSGDDRELPRQTVAEPIVVVLAQAARPVPSRNALCHHAAAVAAEHDIPAPFFANLIQQESGFKSHVVSPAGAQGIAQFMPRVARAYGLENPFDPLHSLAVSAKFLRELLAQFGNLGLAAAAYNAGPRRVQDWMERRGKLPEETRNYVRNITGHPAERWARVKAKTEETTLPARARCPGMPAIEVSIPEAAPVKVAKGKSKAGAKVADVSKATSKEKDAPKDTAKTEAAKQELPKLAAAKAAGPKLAAAKSFTLASAAPGKARAVISNGKIQIMAPEKGGKQPAGKKPQPAKAAAVKDTKPPTKTAAKTAATAKAKTASKSNAKSAAKSAAKPKSPAKQATGKRVKLAAVR